MEVGQSSNTTIPSYKTPVHSFAIIDHCHRHSGVCHPMGGGHHLFQGNAEVRLSGTP